MLRFSLSFAKLTDADRQLWVWLRKFGPRWRELLHIVRPRDGRPLAPAGISVLVALAV